VSLSTEARRLLHEALELREDISLSRWAAERGRTFSRKTALTHEQVWIFCIGNRRDVYREAAKRV
jgi:hypothetical protein